MRCCLPAGGWMPSRVLLPALQTSPSARRPSLSSSAQTRTFNTFACRRAPTDALARLLETLDISLEAPPALSAEVRASSHHREPAQSREAFRATPGIRVSIDSGTSP